MGMLKGLGRLDHDLDGCILGEPLLLLDLLSTSLPSTYSITKK